MVLAPSISSFIAISSLCLSSMSDIFSPGILLTAPMPMFTTVTAQEVVISLFSEASRTGFIQEKSTPYIPATTHAKPM